MTTTEHDSSGLDGSFLNGLFRKSRNSTVPGALLRRSIQLTIVHTIILTLLPYVSLAVPQAESWGANPALLVLFILGPITSVALLSYGQERVGSMLFLSFMPASGLAQVQFLLPWIAGPNRPPLDSGSVPYVAMLLLLAALDLAAAYVAVRIMQSVHGVTSRDRMPDA